MTTPVNNSNACDLGTASAAIELRARSATSAARFVQPFWAATPLDERLARVRELRRLIAEHAFELASASASVRQRPTRESLTAEVLPLAAACRFLEAEAVRVLAPRRLGRRGRPLWLSGVRSEIRREPLGVILIIGPGNYPLLLPGVQLVQSLVAGNAVLLKPGVGGWPVANLLGELIGRSGFDSRLVTILPEATDAAIDAIDARPDKILFTGSALTGRKILSQAARHLVPATAELSGCDAAVVRADADLDLTARALRFGLTLNGGATCLAPKRALVHRAVATGLEGRLADAFSRANPANSSVLPLVATHQLRRLLEEALALGAHFIAGGISGDGSITFPVVLAGVTPLSRLLHEDVFAPVLALVTVADDNEAIAVAAACPFALGASVFSRDESAARALAARLSAGVVTINDLIVPTADPRLPFGGRKWSGFGVTRGAEGLLELTAPRVVTVSRGRFRPAFDAPRAGDEQVFTSYLQLADGRGFKSRFRAFVTLARTLARQRGQTQPNNS